MGLFVLLIGAAVKALNCSQNTNPLGPSRGGALVFWERSSSGGPTRKDPALQSRMPLASPHPGRRSRWGFYLSGLYSVFCVSVRQWGKGSGLRWCERTHSSTQPWAGGGVLRGLGGTLAWGGVWCERFASGMWGWPAWGWRGWSRSQRWVIWSLRSCIFSPSLLFYAAGGGRATKGTLRFDL